MEQPLWPWGVEPAGDTRSDPRPSSRPLAERAVPAPAPPAAAEGDDDRALVEACRAGRREAFDLLVARHSRMVYRLCLRFVPRHEDASDLTQDVFVRAYRGLGRFRGGAKWSTWLYRIAVNVALDRVATKTPAAVDLDVASAVDARLEPADRRLEREEQARRVRRAVALLPRRQRVTLVLRVYHELSHQEIADILGSPVGTVKANLFHALRNLRRLVEEGESS
jgi:RNA polymerase sigma-70 factor (ECF subfamily)